MKYDEVTISRQLETVVPVYVPDMSTPIGRLKHLRHVVEGVPDALFNMDVLLQTAHCGTVGCMLGHASIDTHFKSLGLRGDEPALGVMSYQGEATGDCYQVGAEAFGITNLQSLALFTYRRAFENAESYPITKAHGIARIDRLIAELSL